MRRKPHSFDIQGNIGILYSSSDYEPLLEVHEIDL